ncbi:DNA repair protein RecO [Agitococcus lubricus]|uniref:DNA repair protein RecO n=1 Tax=Agitococcus lubricus TaxID=1077255 RepID=A0A2T5J086_9GAMM|nr:DNA repair protein RecO [Agitococcus lubricus]PTQ89725.1 DNA replication and repair protein RecO [Agitococcus lubricus]
MVQTPILCHAYLLHSRPYRERSRLVDFWTLEHGRVSAVMRQTPPPLFQPCLIAWRGKQSLKSLVQCELAGLPLVLEGHALFAGFYLNELLVRLMADEESHTELFVLYSQALAQLNDPASLELTLRRFESGLLSALGYRICFHCDAEEQILIDRAFYRFVPEQGFVRVTAHDANAWQGQLLLNIATEDYTQAATRQAAKLIFRSALAHLLGNKPLKSRELWLKTR